MKRLVRVLLWLFVVPVVWGLTRGALGVLVAWALFAYLLVRAWPALVVDVRRLFAVRLGLGVFKRHDRQGLL